MKSFQLKMGFPFILILFLLLGCTNYDRNGTVSSDNIDQSNEKVELLISAASSLTDAMTELEKVFEEANSNINVTVNLGSSGKLAQQIQVGAPVDVYISADQNWMDTLQKKNLIQPNTRVDFTGNKIVLITQKDSELNITSFNDIDSTTYKNLAIGNPESVPAGKYAKESLITIGKWDTVKDHFVFAKDVRQVLAYIESGNADVGFVYSSDVLISNQIKVLAEADSKWHAPIIYPAAVTTSSENPEHAQLFVEFLLTDQAQTILNQFGFRK